MGEACNLDFPSSSLFEEGDLNLRFVGPYYLAFDLAFASFVVDTLQGHDPVDYKWVDPEKIVSYGCSGNSRAYCFAHAILGG